MLLNSIWVLGYILLFFNFLHASLQNSKTNENKVAQNVSTANSSDVHQSNVLSFEDSKIDEITVTQNVSTANLTDVNQSTILFLKNSKTDEINLAQNISAANSSDVQQSKILSLENLKIDEIIVAQNVSTANSSDVQQLKILPKSDENSDEDEDYSDYRVGNKSSKHTHHHHKSFEKRLGVTYTWGRWGKWSKCGVSCVQIRERKCIRRIINDTDSLPFEMEFYPDVETKTGCFGMLKRFRLCLGKCKVDNIIMRNEHCATLKFTPFDGKFYNWHGYENVQNECEQFCQRTDADIVVSMNRSVIDGTLCQKPSIYYTHGYRGKAVCVEGICRAVHSSGAIRPATTNDSQRKCGSLLCQVVSELFSKTKLDYGYNHVTTIPVGAMNLTIKQISRSDNLLALRTTDDIFIINGDNHASESGIFEYNDDVYDYNRELGWITSKGPLTKAVVVLLFSRGQNTGVKYDYIIPVSSASVSEEEELQTQWNELGQPIDEINDNDIDENVGTQIARAKERKLRKFAWKLLGFGECNRSCGPGVRSPIFRCIRESPTRYYTPKRCAFAEKPVFSEDIYQCNRGLCQAYWRAGDYDECRCAENSLDGVRTRFVRCVQEQASGKIEEVNEALCEHEKLPDFQETCNCAKQLRRRIYARGPEKTPKVYSRLIGIPSLLRNIYNSTQTLRRHSRDDRVDKDSVWLMSAWYEECLENCGHGYEHRSIYCDRTSPYSGLCDLRYTPEQRRPCSVRDDAQIEAQKACLGGIWFTSEWSNCTGDCFNLQRKRTVVCLRDGNSVGEEECADSKKPVDYASCSLREVNYCGPKWHYSEWSECSRSCGEGVQRRYAKCLEYDLKQNAMMESNNCKYLDREPVYGTCNSQKCEELQIAGTSSNAIPIPLHPNCSDELVNCKRTNRERLCRLQYYKTYCCLTCNGY